MKSLASGPSNIQEKSGNMAPALGHVILQLASRLAIFTIFAEINSAHGFVRAPTSFSKTSDTPGKGFFTKAVTIVNTVSLSSPILDSPPVLQHSDISWRIRPFYGQDSTRSIKNRFTHKVATSAIRFECKITGQNKPTILFPAGGRTVIEAYVSEPGPLGTKKMLAGRFGMTTTRNPPNPLIEGAVQKYLNPTVSNVSAAAGAIIYMYVFPAYRSRGLGALAVDVIAALQSYIGNDAIVLVADDDGSGKLVKWYESLSFQVAEELQDLLGSPDGKYGTAMIAPTYVPETNEMIEGDSISSTNPFLGGVCNIRWW